MLLVAEQNTDACAFYKSDHGLIVERRVDGPSHYTEAMSLDVVHPEEGRRRTPDALHQGQLPATRPQHI